jgi:hypothetical protein
VKHVARLKQVRSVATIKILGDNMFAATTHTDWGGVVEFLGSMAFAGFIAWLFFRD